MHIPKTWRFRIPGRVRDWLYRHTDLWEEHAMVFPTYGHEIHFSIIFRDYCRLSSFGLAIQTVLTQDIPGDFAEIGVYQGRTSRFIHKFGPQRVLYLFDTFEGFPDQALSDGRTLETHRFDDTSIERVRDMIGDSQRVEFCKGYVPDTFSAVENHQFAFVVIDLDIYQPTIDSLEFFYPRMSIGGYIFVHDYNNSEGGWACKRAVDEFLQDKVEKPIEIPDKWGSVVFRKV